MNIQIDNMTNFELFIFEFKDNYLNISAPLKLKYIHQHILVIQLWTSSAQQMFFCVNGSFKFQGQTQGHEDRHMGSFNIYRTRSNSSK